MRCHGLLVLAYIAICCIAHIPADLVKESGASTAERGCIPEVDGTCQESKPSSPAIEALLDVVPSPQERIVRIFYNVFDDSGSLESMCGTECSATWTIRDESHANPQNLAVGHVPPASGEMLIFIGQKRRGTYTISMNVEGLEGHTVVAAASSFEWEPALFLPCVAMERAFDKLADYSEARSGTEVDSPGSVTRLRWSGLDCSLPRAVLRVYELRNVEVRFEKLQLQLPGTAAQLVQIETEFINCAGELLLSEQAPVVISEIAQGSAGQNACQGGNGATALLLVGVGMGTVEHFAHFLWDYWLNLHRVMLALGRQWQWDGKRWGWKGNLGGDGTVTILLQTESMQELYDARPRRFYDLLATLGHDGGVRWEALPEVKDGTCYAQAVVGFGALDSAAPEDILTGVGIPKRDVCVRSITSLLLGVRQRYGVVGEGRNGGVVVLSREGERWRRLVGEKDLVKRWNDRQGRFSGREASLVRMHELSMRLQVQIMWDANVLVGINGAQASAMLMLSPKATAINLYAHEARWTDMGFGAMLRIAAEIVGFRLWQIEVDESHVIPAEYSRDSFRQLRDADISLPYDFFEEIVASALDKPQQEGKPRQRGHWKPLSLEQALGEARNLGMALSN